MLATQTVVTSMYCNSFVGLANEAYQNKLMRDKTVQIEYMGIDSVVKVETNSQETSVRPQSNGFIFSRSLFACSANSSLKQKFKYVIFKEITKSIYSIKGMKSSVGWFVSLQADTSLYLRPCCKLKANTICHNNNYKHNKCIHVARKYHCV